MVLNCNDPPAVADPTSLEILHFAGDYRYTHEGCGARVGGLMLTKLLNAPAQIELGPGRIEGVRNGDAYRDLCVCLCPGVV
jgi:hypothetical protein